MQRTDEPDSEGRLREAAIRAGHEPNEVNVGGLLFFGLWLLAATIAISIGLWGLFRVFNGMEAREQPAMPAHVAANLRRTPEAPRLEALPLAPRRALNAEETEVLTTYGWVDRSAGVVRIPVEEAMRKIAAGGVPGGRPLPPPTPAAAQPPLASSIGSPADAAAEGRAR
jgi:hypothetical protein